MQKILLTTVGGVLGGVLASAVYFIAYEFILHDRTALGLFRLQSVTCFCAVVGFIVATMPAWTRHFFHRNHLMLLMLTPFLFLFFSSNAWDLRLTKVLISPAMLAAVFIGSLFVRPNPDVAAQPIVDSGTAK